VLSVIGVCVYVCVHAVKEKWLELSTPNLECTYALSGFPLTWTVGFLLVFRKNFIYHPCFSAVAL